MSHSEGSKLSSDVHAGEGGREAHRADEDHSEPDANDSEPFHFHSAPRSSKALNLKHGPDFDLNLPQPLESKSAPLPSHNLADDDSFFGPAKRPNKQFLFEESADVVHEKNEIDPSTLNEEPRTSSPPKYVKTSVNKEEAQSNVFDPKAGRKRKPDFDTAAFNIGPKRAPLNQVSFPPSRGQRPSSSSASSSTSPTAHHLMFDRVAGSSFSSSESVNQTSANLTESKTEPVHQPSQGNVYFYDVNTLQTTFCPEALMKVAEDSIVELQRAMDTLVQDLEKKLASASETFGLEVMRTLEQRIHTQYEPAVKAMVGIHQGNSVIRDRIFRARNTCTSFYQKETKDK